MEPTTAASDPVPPVLGAERSRRRDLAHGVVLVVPWGGLAWSWWRLLGADGGSGLALASWVVGVCALVTASVTWAWVAHNLRIARRRGPRRGLPTAVLEYGHDWTGRAVRADWAQARAARVVVITTGDGTKSFLADPTDDQRGVDETPLGAPVPGDLVEVAS